MKRVLVTGATGFIGRNSVVPLLRRGYEVHAVTSKGEKQVSEEVGERQKAKGESPTPKTKNQNPVFWHQVDLLKADSLAALLAEVQPTHLLHFAWYAVPKEYWISLENFRWVRASLELLQAFVDNGGERAVFAGTCAEYDWNYGYCREGITPLNPATTYGRCKSALCALTDTFAKQTGLSASWGRIFFLYGPHEHPSRLVASVARSLCLGETARTSHGRQIRDFLHVEDVAEAFVALLESDVSGAVNIASGQPVALHEVITQIAALLGRPQLLDIGAITTSPNDPPLLVADTRRLAEEVGWTPHYTLTEGLHQTTDWWKEWLRHETFNS
jgi:nucleoside-diphosphate-sugar epimerase